MALRLLVGQTSTEDRTDGFAVLEETFLATFLSPKEVVLAENAPVAASLSRPKQVGRLKEGKNVEGELLGKKGDKVPLHERLNESEQVTHLLNVAELAGHQRVEGGDAISA